MKKLLATLLASSLALSAIGGLVACKDEEPAEVAATGITLSETSISQAPDGQWGVTATLTPANATTKVEWTVADGSKATVSAGGPNNKIALVNFVDTGTTTLTAKVGDKTATCTVTVGEWRHYMLVGGVKTCTDAGFTWDSNALVAADSPLLFKQDTTDLHKWSVEVSVEKENGFKIVEAVKQADGKYKGAGWGEINIGAKHKAKPDDPDIPNVTVTKTGSEVTGENDGNSSDIKAATTDDEGIYEVTLEFMPITGALKSIKYKWLRAATAA